MGIQDARQAAATATPADEPTAVATVDASPVPNHYCLDRRHAARLVTVERFFRWDGERHPEGHPQAGQLIMVEQGHDPFGRPLPPAPITSTCPICSVCTDKSGAGIDPLTGRRREARVSAIPLEYDEQGNPIIPAALRSIAARAGEA